MYFGQRSVIGFIILTFHLNLYISLHAYNVYLHHNMKSSLHLTSTLIYLTHILSQPMHILLVNYQSVSKKEFHSRYTLLLESELLYFFNACFICKIMQPEATC